jgi:hypothetical protein
MKGSNSARGRATKVLSLTVLASLLAFGASAQQRTSASKSAPMSIATKRLSAEELEKRKEWHATMRQIPVPKHGCFTAAYPNTEWQEVPCTPAPNVPYPAREPPRPDIVGGSNDIAAQTSGLISTALGSFVSVTGVTSATGPAGQSNFFSLQINSNTSHETGACKPPSPYIESPGCLGWQQFVYSNSGNAFIQYWLLHYYDSGAPCPSGWNTFTPTPTIPGAPGCWQNSTDPDGGHTGVPVPVQDIADLAQLSLTGKTDGQTDTVIMETASSAYQRSNPPWVNLAAFWNTAEFNIFGDGNSTRTNFLPNPGSTIVVEIAIDDGTSNAPTPVTQSFTVETNNLNLVSPNCPVGGSFPAVVFTESNDPSATSTCLCAAVGERCVGSGDCCSGSCTLGQCQCLPLGSQCPANKPVGCCGPNTCVVNFPGQPTGICNQARNCKRVGAVCSSPDECCSQNCASPQIGFQRHCAPPT